MAFWSDIKLVLGSLQKTSGFSRLDSPSHPSLALERNQKSRSTSMRIFRTDYKRRRLQYNRLNNGHAPLVAQASKNSGSASALSPPQSMLFLALISKHYRLSFLSWCLPASDQQMAGPQRQRYIDSDMGSSLWAVCLVGDKGHSWCVIAKRLEIVSTFRPTNCAQQ